MLVQKSPKEKHMRLDPMNLMEVLKLPIRHEVSMISILSNISGQC